MILPPERPSPRRRRTIKSAMELIEHELHPSHARRQKIHQRVRGALQPKTEAKRIIAQERKDSVRDLGSNEGEVRLSDAQVLREKLHKRDKGIWQPHLGYLKRIEKQIQEGITRPEFEDMAATLLSMVQPLPKSFREAEWACSLAKQRQSAALHGMGAGSEVDLSDTQELEVMLIRRDKGVWPPQLTELRKLERKIVVEGMTRVEFQAAAETLFSIPQTLPKKFREAEWERSRTAD